MRKRRIGYVGGLGLALAVATPGTAMASGTQNAEAGFSPEKNAAINFPVPPANLGSGFSKNGTIREHLFLSSIVGDPPALQTVDIHAPEELKFTTKGLDQCDPTSIEGQTPDQARAICPKAQLGTGQAAAFEIPTPGPVTLFNGTTQNGNPTVLFHTFTANVPIVLISEIQNSPLGSPYGKVFHTPVSTTVGGGGSAWNRDHRHRLHAEQDLQGQEAPEEGKEGEEAGEHKEGEKAEEEGEEELADGGVHRRDAFDPGGLHSRAARADAVADRGAGVHELAS